MRNKLWRVLASLVVLAMVVGGCVAPTAAPAGGGEAAGSGETIELLYMTHNFAQAIEINNAIIEEHS